MKKAIQIATVVMVPAVLTILKGCHVQEKKTDESFESCIEINEVFTTETEPAGVRTVFQIFDCNGSPIVDLTNQKLQVLLDGDEIRTEGDVTQVLTQKVHFEQYTLILLDMSDSIVNTGSLQPMVSAVRRVVRKLVTQGVQVAIYRFAGPTYFAEVQDFTTDEGALNLSLDELAKSKGLGTTDLYGSIPRAINVLESAGSHDVLTTRTLVLFTDGTDEAMASTSKSALASIKSSEAYVFTLGLGGDVDQEELRSFGKDRFEWAEDSNKLETAFDAITTHIYNLARSYYLVAICSPRVGGTHNMTIVVERNGDTGQLTVQYNADNFDIVGCNVNDVAFPCKDRQCGEVDGLICGTCMGDTFCNDSLICEDACIGTIECGVTNGVDCGDCSERGETFICDNHTCTDPCSDSECGPILGIDCGSCSELGDTFTCDDHTCVDACAEAECGTILGVDCGDCSGLGDGFGCDPNHKCVDVCSDAECGTVLGVDCGQCTGGFECSADNICAPRSLSGMSWVKIPGGVFTHGCDTIMDPACDLDEQRRNVELTDFWIMTTEVTVQMFKICTDEGACNSSYVGTDAECNLSGMQKHPVNCIEWEGMKQFCSFIGGRLPTEAQWERAYRGDHDGEAESYWIYPWGNSQKPTCNRVVMNDGGSGCGQNSTNEAGAKPATSFELFNMGGNVSEWTRDFYGETFAVCGGEPCVDPEGPLEGDERVVRGGAWDDFYISAFRTAKRDKNNPQTKSPTIGGRCVKQL